MFGADNATQLTVGAVEVVFPSESVQASERRGSGGVPAFQRGMEMPHAVPLIGDPSCIQGTVFFFQEHGDRAIIFFRIDTKYCLFVQPLDPWRKTFAVHGEGGKIRVRKAMRIGVVLLDVQKLGSHPYSRVNIR